MLEVRKKMAQKHTDESDPFAVTRLANSGDPLDAITSAGTTTTTQKLRGYLNVKHNPTSKKARANPLRRVRQLFAKSNYLLTLEQR